MPGPRQRSTVESGPLAGLSTVTAARRHTLALTQQELAELAGVGVSSVRALEAGADSLTLAIVVSILDALGLQLLVTQGAQPAVSVTGASA